MSLIVYPILCNAGFMDNYAYLLVDKKTGCAAIVDAAQEQPIVNFCKQKNILPQFILTTHHHLDHTNANLSLKKRYGLKVVGSFIEKDLINGLDIPLNEGDLFTIGESCAQIILASGHTKGHLLWYFDKEKMLFTGDVLFNLCIGGLFEGTPHQMWQSLQKIKALPDNVRFFPGHEYTNASMLLNSENPAFKQYLQFLNRCQQNKQPPVGNILGLEKQCNPYLCIDNENDFIQQMS